MSTEPSTEGKTPKPAKSSTEGKAARVRIIENGLTIGDFRYAANHIAESIPLADAEFREGKGQLEILNINP